MQLNLLIKTLVLSIIVLVSSCQKDPVSPSLPYRKDVPVMLGTHVLSYDSTIIRFSFDLAVFKGDNETKEVQEFTGLSDSSFKFEDYTWNGKWVRHTIEKSEFVDTVPKNSFLTMFLIDQSVIKPGTSSLLMSQIQQ